MTTSPSPHDEQPSQPSRKGYGTLFGWLLAILLFAVIAALLWPSIGRRSVNRRDAHIKIDLDQVSHAMGEFRTRFGAHPPSFSHKSELHAFLLRAFPRCDPAKFEELPNLSAAEAWVFWLGGFWDGERMVGFSADSRNPFVPAKKGETVQRTGPIFEFEETRLFDRNANGFPEYYPPGARPGESTPYVYFVPDKSGNYSGSYRHSDTSGVATPYHSDKRGFMNPDSFQIIAAGIDDDFGAAGEKLFPSGKGYGPGDEDNLTNFADRTLGDSRP